MDIFVTGATGAVGRLAVPALFRAGHRVSGVARTDAKASQLVTAGAGAVRVSIFDHGSLVSAMAGHDAVVNLATRIPPLKQISEPDAWAENDRIRREASATLAGAAVTASVGRFVPVTRRELGRIIGRAVGARPWLHVPGRFTRLVGQQGSALARSQRVSNRHLRAATGWSPSFPSSRQGWADIVANGHDRG